MTKHRKLILQIIMSSMNHMTAEEIYREAKKVQSTIAVGTVYRNLGLMTEAGQIRRISMQNAPDRYDRLLAPHEHIICQKCGALSDISVSDLHAYLEKQTGYKIVGYDLNIRYICDECKREGSDE